jgi:proliferating cell nuclear antigen PCNA
MKLEINDKRKSDSFINIFNNLKCFTDKINLIFTEDKLHVQGMDTSHVCVYELFINKEWFNEWDVSESETYGIYLPTFNKMLHTCCTEKQGIVIHNETPDKLNVEFVGQDKGIFNKYFEMPLIDIECDMLHIPESVYDVDIVMESKKFKMLIDEISHFDDTVNIKCNEGEFSVEANGNEGTMKVVISIDDVESYSVVENETIEISFGTKYLSQMCQFHKLADNCAIHISRDLPIQIKYNMGEYSIMRFYLAPKID